MKSWKTQLGLVALMAFATLAPFAPVAAEEMPLPPAPLPADGIISLKIADHANGFTILKVEVGPDLGGSPATVRFGPAPFSGGIVAHTVLSPGMNVIAVPVPPIGGWYTVEAAGRVKTTDDEGPGIY